jgi:hypothetical protein
VIAYHKLPRKKLPSIQKSGLLRKESKGRDSDLIKQTDEFLNTHRPDKYADSEVDRICNIFCYLSDNGKVIDVADGVLKAPDAILRNNEDTLLQLHVDPKRSYVGDLDLLDAIKACLASNDTPGATRLAREYWESIQRLDTYPSSGTKIQRPELLITYDIPPTNILQKYG